MRPRFSIVCAGYMPLDVVISGGPLEYNAGGTAANVAAILAFLGWEAALAGQVGDDRAGELLLADLGAAGVDTSHIRCVANALTPRLIYTVGHDGHSFGYTCPECRQRVPRSRPLTLEGAERCAATIPTPDVYFFDRANPATVWLAERYAEAGSVIVFEPSIPVNAALLRRAAAVAHVVKHSDDRSVGGLADLGLRPRAGDVRVVTHGAEGLELSHGSARPRRLGAMATLAVDTGGAGDWTTAGLLWRAVGPDGLIEDAVEEALRFGQAIAALNCAVAGARGLMRLTRRTVLRRSQQVLVDGALTRPLRIPAPAPVAPNPPGCCEVCLQAVARHAKREVA